MTRSLSQLAWGVFGPIDFVVNLIINVACPFIFLGFSATIPLFGVPSVSVFLASACFFVLTLATFFGFRNGVLQKQAGDAGKVTSPPSWHRKALMHGMAYAFLGQCILWPSLLAIDWMWPELRCSVATLAVLNGLFSGVLAYFTQVNGMLQAGRLEPAPALGQT